MPDYGDSTLNSKQPPLRRQIQLRHRAVPAHRNLVWRAAFDQAGGGQHRHLVVDRLGVAARFARQTLPDWQLKACLCAVALRGYVPVCRRG